MLTDIVRESTNTPARSSLLVPMVPRSLLRRSPKPILDLKCVAEYDYTSVVLPLFVDGDESAIEVVVI